jgi:hypothetical protein
MGKDRQRRCIVPPKKIRYRTELDARLALFNGAADKGSIRVYRCEFCRGWHSTSQPPRKQPDE